MIKTYGQTPKQLFWRPHPMPYIRLTTHEKIATLPLTTTANVMGLKWGHIVGISSPSTQVFGDFATRVSLMPLSRNRMLGIPHKGAVSLFHGSSSSSNSSSKGEQQQPTGRACVISLDPTTGWAMAHLKRGTQPRFLLPLSNQSSDRVTCVHSIPDVSSFWIGHSSGKLTAITYSLNTSTLQLTLQSIQSLYGHDSGINDIAASREWSVVVTASSDGSSIVWDTRGMSYVRSIRWSEDKSTSHKLVKISPTNGDLAIVNGLSDLLLFSLNDRFVAVQKGVQPSITSLAFSHEPDGTAVNVIATGHSKTGVIRLWSTWDLSPQRELPCSHTVTPITSLAFSLDSKYLYASFADGFLAIFERESPASPVARPPNYLDLSRIMSS